MLCVYAYAVVGVPLTIYTALKSFGISFHTLVVRLRGRSVKKKKRLFVSSWKSMKWSICLLLCY